MGAQWPQKAGAVHHSRTEGPAAPHPASEMPGSLGPACWPVTEAALSTAGDE